MEETQLKKPVWVARPAALEKMVSDLVRFPILAVDTESNSLFAYREQVCLIQFSTPEEDYLVDPLAITDLSPLAPLFANPEIEKVFHAAEYDVICLQRDFGFRFSNLFDTMVAGRILGRSALGLGSMILEEFGVELDKHYQRANWGQRPLPPAQLAYARLDTHYLIALRDRLKPELIEKDRWPLAQEDFQRLALTQVPEPDQNNGSCWRIANNQELNVQQIAVLHALCAFRDKQARAANLPHFKVLSNDVLLNTAVHMPQSLEELAVKVPMLSQKQLDRFGWGLLEAVRIGLKSDPPHRPHYPRPDEQFLARLDALRNWRKLTAREAGVESDVVLPRDLMEMIAQANPRTKQELAALMQPVPWRLNTYGDHILRVINS